MNFKKQQQYHVYNCFINGFDHFVIDKQQKQFYEYNESSTKTVHLNTCSSCRGSPQQSRLLYSKCMESPMSQCFAWGGVSGGRVGGRVLDGVVWSSNQHWEQIHTRRLFFFSPPLEMCVCGEALLTAAASKIFGEWQNLSRRTSRVWQIIYRQRQSTSGHME